MKHDMTLTIAVGNSRRQKYWKHRTLTWEELTKKLSDTYRTQETEAAYGRMSKTNRDSIKDVGGFVGGRLLDGRRRRDSIKDRCLVCLDLDYAPDDFADTLKMLFSDFAWCLYSTHSHTDKTPRYRLIIPLTEAVTPDAYEPLARMIAGDIGMSYFDETTFEPNRLMYWPSTSSDGNYIYEVNDAAMLAPADILRRYKDWKNVLEWPQSEREVRRTGEISDKQQDPEEKPGLVGAFCRTYGVRDAIEKFLADVYSPCDFDDRYTYLKGSTAAGLVIYDDKFAYSHHGTDPAGGLLCNSYDLVRLHKFRELDDDMQEDTPTNRLKSYKAMVDLARSDEDVMLTLGKEKIESAKDEFGEADAEEDYTWMKKLTSNKQGDYEPTIENLINILTNDPRLRGKMHYNMMSKRMDVRGKLPWAREDGDWKDLDDAGIRHYIERVYRIFSSGKLFDAVNLYMTRNAFHPVKDYLDSLEWDGQERIETLLIEYFGAEDSRYTRAVTKKWLAAGAARIYRPGCKFDYMLVLVGDQGIGKSTLAMRLGKDWYSDSFDTLSGKDAYEAIQGVWVAEMAEMSAIRKAEVEHIKLFVSTQQDSFRAAYGRRKETHARQCIFMGNSNTDGFLQDETGNRRFWSVKCGVQKPTKDIFNELNEEEIDQVWAEAKYWFKKNEKLFLGRELEEEAQEIQKRHLQIPDFTGLIEEYLEERRPLSWYEKTPAIRIQFFNGGYRPLEDTENLELRIGKICASEIKAECPGFEYSRLSDLILSRNINKALLFLGWKKKQVRIPGYGSQTGFIRPGGEYDCE